MITDKYSIREQNEALLLKHIIQAKEISRAELAIETELNKASVSAIVKKLLADHLILETRIGDAGKTGGRKPIMLTFQPHAATMLAVDLGVNYIEGAIAFLDGEVIGHIKREQVITAKNVLAELQSLVEELLMRTPASFHGTVGMSVSVHGLVQQQSIRFTPYYDLDQLNLSEELAHHYPWPVFIENEANLAALGEYVFGSADDYLVSISVHSGIGAGIVRKGELITGEHGKAGEIGHAILFPNGQPCPCGNKGCLEQYASSKALYEQAALATDATNISSEDILQLSETNLEVQKLLEQNAFYLSIGINNLITLNDPNSVILNSSVYQKMPHLMNRLKAHLHSKFTKEVRLQLTALEDKAILYGGFALVTQAFLNIKELKFVRSKG